MPLVSQTATSSLPKVEEDIVEALKGLTLPLTQPDKVAASPLKGFVTPQEGPKIKHDTMGPKAYDLLLKADNDPIRDKAKGQVPPEVTSNKVYGLKDTQNMMRKKGWPIKNPTTGLGYTSKPPLCLLIKKVMNHHDKEKPKAEKELPMIHSRPMGKLCGDIRPRGKLCSLDGQGLKKLHFKKLPRKLSQKSYWKKISPPMEKDALLTPEEEIEYVTLLKEFKDVFAWTYNKIVRLDPKG
ncbi:hypothetical protein LIER_12811 [Lithospermum erythrorhizon]|uniref:Uncharacterized protein n=1 Tax=Lithospermum erythrorhizon TaxID=34254 RepID=A0AAV3PTC6_LITER